MKKYLMKCGHVNNAEQIMEGGVRIPACAICSCTEIEREVQGTDGLEGRQMQCTYCGRKEGSRWNAPFFEYKPESPFDRFYDGCWGWD